MDKYIITIKAANRTYTYGRFWDKDDVSVAVDTLEALFHLKLIDEFNIKEAVANGNQNDTNSNLH